MAAAAFALMGSSSRASYAALAGVVVLALLIAWPGRKGLGKTLGAASVLLLTFALIDAEVALLLRPRITIDNRPASLIVSDPLLGYRPRPDSRVTLTLDRFGKRIYRAIYTIDPSGFRLTRGGAATATDTTVFLGDSYTFGDALDDRDALPQQYADARGGRDKVINAAFSGYGTHQVLRLLESGRLDGLLKGASGAERRTFIYLVIDEHLRRIEGRAPGDWLGTPRYQLQGGAARYIGRYHSGLAGAWAGPLSSSALAIAIGNALMIAPRPQSTELFGAMVQEAQRIARRRYQAGFLVLLWDEPLLLDRGSPDRARRRAALVDRIAAELKRRDVPVLRVSELVPDYRAHMSDFVIPGNGHPSARLTHVLGLKLASRPLPRG